MKRILDVTIAVFVIACVLSWLLPILAFLIVWDSEGPVFFVQKRVGRHFRVFSCYKLRTMVVNEHADQQPVKGDDARITRLGSWLRRSHFDELPQFFNVLMGTMSVVGPRPYMPVDCRMFAKIVHDDSIRYRVRPGITGLAQAEGLHDVFCDRDIILQRYQCDAFYVAHAGLGLDLYILGRTFIHLLLRPLRAGRSRSPGYDSIGKPFHLLQLRAALQQEEVDSFPGEGADAVLHLGGGADEART